MVRILFLGDVVGEPGRKAVIHNIPKLKAEHEADFIIVNGENSAGGRGITPKICTDLMRAGATIVTSGDHIWDQPEIIKKIEEEPRLLRPLNYPPDTPGNGSCVLELRNGEKVAVINAQGRTFMKQELENPFLAIQEEVNRLREETKIIFVDFHAETTSEKYAMGRFLDGQVSAVVGTHTHVQTADEQIFPGGTAFLCDAGMCGPAESIIGSKIEGVLTRFITARPARFHMAKGAVRLCGAVVDVNSETGKAERIERLCVDWAGPEEAENAG